MLESVDNCHHTLSFLRNDTCTQHWSTSLKYKALNTCLWISVEKLNSSFRLWMRFSKSTRMIVSSSSCFLADAWLFTNPSYSFFSFCIIQFTTFIHPTNDWQKTMLKTNFHHDGRVSARQSKSDAANCNYWLQYCYTVISGIASLLSYSYVILLHKFNIGNEQKL